MAGKITELGTLTGASAATTDIIEAVDISDTSMAATGTNKKISLAEMVSFFTANGIQALNTNLTTIAGLTATTTNVLQSVGSAWASRTPAQLTATLPVATTSAAGLLPQLNGTVTTYLNGNGAFSTPPTGQAADATLTALAAYNTNGLLTQTAADTFTGRTLTGTTNRVTVSNGNGVAGAPTFDIGTDVVTLTDTQTLTGKTIALGSNTVSGTLAQFNTAITDANVPEALNGLTGVWIGTQAQYDAIGTKVTTVLYAVLP